MSGIYIPDMEMPKSCLGELNGKNDCPIVGICGIFKATPFKEKENIVWEQRLKDCPLEELPTHGKWHTETPTEEGDYLIQTKRTDIETGKPFFMVGSLGDVQWFQREGHEKLSCYCIVAWQKIEPYRG